MMNYKLKLEETNHSYLFLSHEFTVCESKSNFDYSYSETSSKSALELLLYYLSFVTFAYC